MALFDFGSLLKNEKIQKMAFAKLTETLKTQNAYGLLITRQEDTDEPKIEILRDEMVVIRKQEYEFLLAEYSKTFQK